MLEYNNVVYIGGRPIRLVHYHQEDEAMKQKEFIHKGKKYLGIENGGKVKVSVERTARKQLINLGVYDIKKDRWQDTNKSQMIPDIVKKGFAIEFGKPGTLA